MSNASIDRAHVVIDALKDLSVRIENGYTPWAFYEGDEGDDPKVTEEGYVRLLAEAIEAAEAEVAEEYDTESSASRQHYIDTGRYLAKGEAVES